MARRATVFSQYNDTPDTLRIAGPYEFNKWDGSTQLHTGHDTSLFRGYATLDYSLGILAQDEGRAATFLQNDHSEGAWVALSTHPKVHRLATSNGKIAVVVFPAAPKKEAITDAMIQDVLSAIKAQRDDPGIELIIGVSPWGRQQEQKFLDTHPGGCDVLLGSGPGPGLTSSLTSNRQTLWVRAYSKGRTVSMVQIEQFPDHNAQSAWRVGQNINAKLLVLNEKIQKNQAMQKTLAPMDATTKTSGSRGKASCGS